MNNLNSIVDIKKYGTIKVKLAEIMDSRGITRNKLANLMGVRYEVIDRYYKASNIERLDVDILAKACYVLNCSVSDLLEYSQE